MAKSKKDVEGGLGIHARRAIAYIVLIIISFFCLFWFYIMFINATRSKGELKAGFTALPSDHLLTNWNNLVHGTLPIWSGMFNSLIIAAATAVLCVYFSTMTAYAIHAYDFKLKKFIYPFILMIMMIPTQVTALGFIKLITGMGLMDSFIPLIVPAIASPVTFFYMKQYMESALPLSLIEAARIDGSGEFRTFNSIVLPLMKPAKVLTARPQMASRKALVMPKFCMSTPMVQVHSTQLEPTDRSMPAVIRAHSIPEAIRQLMDAAFRIFMALPTFGNFSGMVTLKIRIRINSASSVPSFCRSSFIFVFFISV